MTATAGGRVDEMVADVTAAGTDAAGLAAGAVEVKTGATNVGGGGVDELPPQPASKTPATRASEMARNGLTRQARDGNRFIATKHIPMRVASTELPGF